MFWSGNYIVVRELNSLLKEENVSLTQVLEADDILQECKADNKALIQFLTRPEILAELITLITEEPPKHVELSYQYRHASIACEVLTSHLSMLSDRLSMDTVQMHRLCDFINQEPPLNPLLASYFSKTVEMLLDRNPKQDWYFYHIVCLRVLDFFKSRRDFLPNLLRHLATSAIADTFKFFIRLDDLDNLFNKIVMEWLDEHQFLESLIQIMCGTYVPEPLPARGAEPERETGDHRDDSSEDEVKVSDHNAKETSAEKPEASRSSEAEEAKQTTEDDAKAKQRSIDRMKAVASANAAALLCDILLTGCAGEGSNSRPRTGWVLATRLLSPQSVAALLSGVFTSPPRRRQHALLSGCRLLQTLLDHHTRAEWPSVELALAPHLPLLHQALLHDPDEDLPEDDTDACAYRGPRPRVGLARIQVAALLAQLALSQAEEVAATMMTLGTPGALVSLMFAHPDTNLLHAHVHAYVARALANTAHRHAYTEHLLGECDLLTRLMDAFEENEEKKTRGEPRSGYMGHVVGMLSAAARADPPRAPPRWPAFRDNKLAPLLQRHDTALGGFYPSDNIYEMDNTDMSDAMATAYEYNDMMSAGMEDMGEDINNDVLKLMCTGLGSGEANELSDNIDPTDSSDKKERMLCNLPVSNNFGDDMWDEVEPDIVDQAVQDLFCDVSPWESRLPAEGAVSEGWAQFEAFPDAPADDMFWRRDTTPDADKKDLEQNQTLNQNQSELRSNQGQSLEESSVELANNLLHAMSSMALDDIANIVNANLTDVVTTKPDSPKHVETTNEGKIDNESPVEKLSNESNNETSASTSVVENKSFADTNFGKQNSFAENENLAENKFPDTNFGENKNFADTSFGEKTYFAESTSVVENKGFADTNLGEKNSFESTSVVENKSISENTNVVENKSFTDTSVVENKSSENTSVVENKSSENTNIVEDKSVADTNFGENSFESTSVVENSSFSESTSCDNGSAGTEAQDSES